MTRFEFSNFHVSISKWIISMTGRDIINLSNFHKTWYRKLNHIHQENNFEIFNITNQRDKLCNITNVDEIGMDTTILPQHVLGRFILWKVKNSFWPQKVLRQRIGRNLPVVSWKLKWRPRVNWIWPGHCNWLLLRGYTVWRIERSNNLRHRAKIRYNII